MKAYDRLITQVEVEEEFAEEQKLESIRNKELLKAISEAGEDKFVAKQCWNDWDILTEK